MPRTVNDDDWLYRKVEPDHWGPNGIHPEAFESGAPNTSFFIASHWSPAPVLERFSHYNRVRRQCNTGAENPTAEQMYHAGFRIAKIRVADVKAAGLRFKPTPDGDQYNDDGHVEIDDGVSAIATLASIALLVTDTEMR